MRKKISILLTIAFLLSTFAFAAIGVGAQAEPTASRTKLVKDPAEFGTVPSGYTPESGAVEIKSAADLASLTPDGNYYLSGDLDLTGVDTIPSFTGTFDGCGHKVTVSKAVFQSCTGTVKNLIIEGSVTAESGVVGALINSLSGAVTLENIANYANVTNNGTTDSDVTGGLVGKLSNKSGDTPAVIKNCYNKGDVTGPEAVGGILGESQSASDMVSFEGCLNDGKITANAVNKSGNAAAGIMGYSGTGKVILSRCVNTGDVTALYNAGGIVGDARKSGTVENCINYGNVTGAKQVGGICGRGSDGDDQVHTVRYCMNYGTVTGGQYVAGIEGYIYGSPTASKASYGVVENCINFGDVVGNAAGVYVSQALGYSNVSTSSTIRNILGTGKLSIAEGVTGYTVVFGVHAKTPAVKDITFENSFYIGADAKPTYYTHDAEYEGNIILFEEVDNKDLADSTTVKKVTTADAFSDELAAAVNAAFGATVVVNSNGAVALAEGVITPGYTGGELPGEDETTQKAPEQPTETPTEKPTEAPTDAPTEAPTETEAPGTNAPTTEKPEEKGGCKSAVISSAAILLTACAAAVVVGTRKKH